MRLISLLCLLISLAFSSLPGQDQAKKPDTLIKGPIHHGFYLAPVAKITRMDGESVFFAGGKLAWLINHRFAIGFAGYGRVDNFEWDWFHDHSIIKTDQMGYGGLLLEANFFPMKILRINTGLLLGAGAINRPDTSEKNKPDDWRRHNWNRQNTDIFMAIEPEINLELSITSYCALGLGIGYRFFSGIDTTSGSSNAKMSGLTSALTLKFGRL